MIYDTFKDFDRVSNYTLPDWGAKHAQDTPMVSVWISNCGIETTHCMSIMEELASHGITYASYGGCKQRTRPTGPLQSEQ